MSYPCKVLWDDTADIAFKRDVLLFINTIVNSSLDVEERIETRSDMIYAGLLDAFEKLKSQADKPIAVRRDDSDDEGDTSGEMSDERYEVEMQMQLFETVGSQNILQLFEFFPHLCVSSFLQCQH